MSNLIDPSVSLIRYFAGPVVTSVSLFLICWPNHVSSELEALADLPTLCPNVNSFTAFFPHSSYNDHANEICDIVRRWRLLQTLRSCALPVGVRKRRAVVPALRRTRREHQGMSMNPKDVQTSCTTHQIVSANAQNDRSSHTHQSRPKSNEPRRMTKRMRRERRDVTRPLGIAQSNCETRQKPSANAQNARSRQTHHMHPKSRRPHQMPKRTRQERRGASRTRGPCRRSCAMR